MVFKNWAIRPHLALIVLPNTSTRHAASGIETPASVNSSKRAPRPRRQRVRRRRRSPRTAPVAGVPGSAGATGAAGATGPAAGAGQARRTWAHSATWSASPGTSLPTCARWPGSPGALGGDVLTDLRSILNPGPHPRRSLRPAPGARLGSRAARLPGEPAA